ncbi:uncharacterized protein LOC130740872 isoform X2 [Lotus japonicus]|uniref:uncharacterized protein LOC130740872 isoform X2 n=1 Tax=Lotus japonicus TaxID=34305 RepID=UPI002584DEBD|nr:uncharacterized protein LOC130740872 isoform X2 [Lotus japonicus]
MVGHTTATKPSRSDEVLDSEEQLRIANQIRAQFDAFSPKRPIKPNRSEPDPFAQNPVDSSTLSDQDIPELHKFQSLQSQSEAILSTEGIIDAQDEFVETQYYKELTSIDKTHHTTGSGFIKAVTEGGEGGYEIANNGVAAGETRFRGYKGNPATNDWVPNCDDDNLVYT